MKISKFTQDGVLYKSHCFYRGIDLESVVATRFHFAILCTYENAHASLIVLA